MASPLDPATGPSPHLRFDRVLCDVPCSGDGTLRKALRTVVRKEVVRTGPCARRQTCGALTPSPNQNPNPNPNPNPDPNANHLPQLGAGPVAAVGREPRQRSASSAAQPPHAWPVAHEGRRRAVSRLVYSTCSMNPVEDEAVIAHAAKRVAATHRLISTSEMIPQLQRRCSAGDPNPTPTPNHNHNLNPKPKPKPKPKPNPHPHPHPHPQPHPSQAGAADLARDARRQLVRYLRGSAGRGARAGQDVSDDVPSARCGDGYAGPRACHARAAAHAGGQRRVVSEYQSQQVRKDTGGFFICVFERMRGAEAEEAKEAEKAKAADAKEAEAEEEPAAEEAEVAEAGGSAEAEAEADVEAEAPAEVEAEAGQGGPKQATHVLGPLHHGALRYLVITPRHLVSTPGYLVITLAAPRCAPPR
eukprot:scaffold20634_cov41-Phaeocystis_antarctica.AAC.1